MRYDAFISYSHAADHRLAPELQTGLQQLARAWYKPRALRVFRDRSSLAVTPALWPAIEKALADARFFIYLASPQAAASEWVDREIRWWLERRAAQSVLIVLTDGELDWDDPQSRFSIERSTALPSALIDAFPEEPRYLDLRWARTRDQVSMRLPAFRDSVAELAATIHGIPKDELEGDDVRQHRRTRRIAWTAAIGLAALTIASVTGATIAVRQRNLAAERGQIALARQLAAQASVILTESPDRLPLAIGLATEAVARYNSAETQRALRSLLALRPFPLLTLNTGGTPSAVAFSPDSRRFALATMEGWVAAWDSPSGTPTTNTMTPADTAPEPSWVFSADAPARAIAFTPNSEFVAVAAGTAAFVLRASSGERVLQLDAADTVRSIAIRPQGDQLAAFADDGVIRLWSLPDGRELSHFEADDEVNAIGFSPDGAWLAWIGLGGGLCLTPVDAAEREPFCRFTRGEGLYLAWLPDSKRIVSVSANFAQLWDTQSDGPLTRMEHVDAADDAGAAHLNWIQDVAVSPDGKQIATGGGIDYSVRVWNADAGNELRRMHHAASNIVLRFSPAGNVLASGAGDGTVRIWDPLRGVERLRGTHWNSVNVLAFDNSGRRLLSGSSAGDITLWDLTPGDEIRRARHSRQTVELAVNTDGSRVATLDRDGWLHVSDSAGVTLGSVRPGFQMRRLLFLNRDTLLAWRSDDPHWIDVTDGDSLEVQPVVDDDAADVIAFSSLHLLAEDAATDSLLVLGAASGDTLLRLGPPASWRNVSLSRDGRLLAIEQPAEHVTVVELPSGTARTPFPVGASFTDIRVSNDGQRVAALVRGGVRIWIVRGSTARVTVADSSLAFSAILMNSDGTRVIARTDEELLVYDGNSGWDPLESTCRHASLSIL